MMEVRVKTAQGMELDNGLNEKESKSGCRKEEEDDDDDDDDGTVLYAMKFEKLASAFW